MSFFVKNKQTLNKHFLPAAAGGGRCAGGVAVLRAAGRALFDVGFCAAFFFLPWGLLWEFLLYNGDCTLVLGIFLRPGYLKQQAVVRHWIFDSGKSFFLNFL